ncbi:hypothetical protein PCANC_19353 [Puccinia coronata f. sp. avenae]|uniref:Prolyl 4-hydroxylase alpha subunit Fe(2+) 2OG dioxygenase domain-containing protein n=1 Tax=Puccinia coronata f. sp. avenae TaxID=200324 RepID=A0A2N5SDQ5_9BASI|nr:hypothetical protein PCANC_19353 [Puccinia coronata f. sp. avenae]PLW51480.1 hypothetical protein PCASD_00278 [Puccinia coronata f. sp. avenae]
MSFNFMGGNDPTPTYNAFGEIVFEFGFPNNLSSMNFMPSKTSNGLRARNSDGPDDDTSSKDDATEGNDANDANASTSEDLGYDISLKEDLNKAFKVIKAPGSFAAWEALPTIPPAGLKVEGVGDIAFPLQEQTVRQLIAKSHQAPYGRRSETLVDVSVRNTWEINRDHLQFFDPAWQRYLVDLGDLVATKLGIDGPIRLELYKLLIYEKGAMFKAHTDTEKTPGMFGTLVICLPSAHTGGEVIVTHNGVTKTLKTSDAPQSFACWYSDVMHQVLPVKSGYQCILTYNLAIKPGLTPPTATASNYQKENIRKTLQVWLKQLGNRGVESHLYCALQHEYTEAAMSLQALKTDDLIRAQVMHDLTSELPFEIFLALLEKKAEGFPEEEDYNPRKRCRYSYDDYGEDEDDDDDEEEDYHSRSKTKGGFHIMTDIMDTSYAVKSLHALDGTRIARDYRFDMKSCLEEDPFLDRQVAEEDYESYTGNEGPAATHWYRRETLVIVPHRKLRHYLARCKSYKSVTNNNTKSVIAYLAKVCSLPTARKPMLDAMKKLFGEQSLAGLPTGTIGDILKAALQHSDFQLFKDTAGCHRGQLSDTFLDWVKEWLDAHPTAELSEKCQNWIPILLSGCQTFSDRINILRKISRTDGDGQTTSTPWAQDLIRQFINNFVETSGMYPGEDAKVMVSAVFNLNEQWAVKSAFLASIFDRFQTLSLGGLSSETIHDILKAALQHSDYQLFKSTTGSHHGYMPDTFFDWVKEWLDTLPESDLLEKCQNWIPLLLS